MTFQSQCDRPVLTGFVRCKEICDIVLISRSCQLVTNPARRDLCQPAIRWYRRSVSKHGGTKCGDRD